ncbi:hypothetical protein PISMIDRAFT_505886 [Pisolithus microcarpus 441]|uniref:Unplaced genomic scaffold scaffold_56, whole genome shotgun sequence n=1 Tax=Pisolithus microcarpus 441 TaxID=765257 RepID=A0A0C9ZRJ1_9AGAM|nr:hypothetical protein PISMIDRAFT_505886 [Pisolithus microcarpus 441]
MGVIGLQCPVVGSRFQVGLLLGVSERLDTRKIPLVHCALRARRGPDKRYRTTSYYTHCGCRSRSCDGIVPTSGCSSAQRPGSTRVVFGGGLSVAGSRAMVGQKKK